MTVTVYGEPVHCDECGSDNTVERELRTATEHGVIEYPAAVCLACGWSRSL
jgi:predicted nucleic-acid-binding Zn-ribbon protein